MKNAKIFHGTSCTPRSFWFPYLKRELEKRGYRVNVPQFPQPDSPENNLWLPVALKQGAYDKDTVIVGHSAGAALVLSVLEHLHMQVRLAILVAGFGRQNPKWERREGILQSSYNWEKIKRNAKELIYINSDNDPWGIDDGEGRYMLDHLGGTLIIKHGAGHMGSDTFKQPYKEFPLLIKLIE